MNNVEKVFEEILFVVCVSAYLTVCVCDQSCWSAFCGCVKHQAGGCWAIPTGAERVGKKTGSVKVMESSCCWSRCWLCFALLQLSCPCECSRESIPPQGKPAERRESSRKTAAITRSVCPTKLLFMSSSAVLTEFVLSQALMSLN